MANTVIMPKLGFDMREGTLVRWLKAEGEPVAKGDVLAEIETDKATVEVESNFDGIVARQLVEQGAVVPVGDPIAIIAAKGEAIDEKTPVVDRRDAGSKAGKMDLPVEKDKPTVTPTVEPEERPFIKASPLAKRMAQENQLDLGAIKGTGPGGRITRQDVEAAMASTAKPVGMSAEAIRTSAAVQIPNLELGTAVHYEQRSDEIVPLEKLRAAIGRRMVEAKQGIPHFYVTNEYDVEDLVSMRTSINKLIPEEEKISLNDLVVKASALTLADYRNLNASLDGDRIIRHGNINIGVAVSIPGGLMTVVVRDADRKPLRQIAKEVREMAERARTGKVRPDDIEGSTFSISNLGMFDVDHFSAIINPPEAAILAVGSVKQVPAVYNGVVVPRHHCKATLSVDHRISDGVEAANFMRSLKNYLEEPILLIMRGL